MCAPTRKASPSRMSAKARCSVIWPVPEGLDLGSGELEPGLDPVAQVVVVPSPAVVGDQLGSVGACHVTSVAKRELDLAVGAVDLLDPDRDRIAEPVAAPGAATDERGRERVQLEVLAGAGAAPAGSPRRRRRSARRARSRSGRRSRPSKHVLPAGVEEPALEEPGEAERVGPVLDLGGLALARPTSTRRARGSSSGSGSSASAELAQERAVDDEVGIAADRRREVAVRATREARVAEVLLGS